MSIFVSIACLDIDNEIINTVRSCIDNSSHPEEVFIGICFIGNENFFNTVKNNLFEYKNIRYLYLPMDGNLGVGKGRSGALSLYQQEDYFFQIDAHTFFLQEWDTTLINKLNYSKKITKNNKVVLSGLPGMYSYGHDDVEEFFYDNRTLYQLYFKDALRIYNKLNINI